VSARAVLARPSAGSGTALARRALVAAVCGSLCVGMTACESTEQQSAQIGRENAAAERAAAAHAKHEAAAHARATHAHGHSPGHSHSHSQGVTHG
jgi:hypothetical protein